MREAAPDQAVLRVHYYRVHDPSYPRNRLIRAHLSSRSDIEVTLASASGHGNRSVRVLVDHWKLVQAALRSDVVVLSEMRLKHALPVALVCWATDTRLVVDGFIGLHETTVDDWKLTPSGSPRARILGLLDRLAVRVADVYLTDTEFRARAVRRRHPGALVVSVPVGAPTWALPQPPARNPVLELLYYGNYIPLHGLDLVVEGLSALRGVRDFRVTFIGNGPLRAGYERRILDLGLNDRCVFLDAVDESELAAHIKAADVVLGIFGTSEKARGVIANKVWQGLACGRTTVTRQSPALDEIRDAAADLLVTTTPGSSAALAAALGALPQRPGSAPGDVHRRLRRHVDEGLATFEAHLREVATRRPRRPASGHGRGVAS